MRLYLGLLVLAAGTALLPRLVAQTYVFSTLAGQAWSAGYADGAGVTARFNDPTGIVVDSRGNIFVTEVNNVGVRQITPAGAVSTFSSQYTGAIGLALDAEDHLVAASYFRKVVGRFSITGVWTILAGRIDTPGTQDGIGTDARFRGLHGAAVDAAGNIYVSDSHAHTIRKVSPMGNVVTLAGSPDTPGSSDGTGSAARFYGPTGIALDRSGFLYVADYQNHTIRRISPAGAVTTFAGSAGLSGSVDATGTAARFNHPIAVAIDQVNYVLVADLDNATIRRISPAGIVTTIGGMPGQYGSVDGTRSDARFSAPYALAVDAASNLYVADAGAHVIRKGSLTEVEPGIFIQPESRNVTAGSAVGLSVVAVGPGPLTYQWRHNGQTIPAAVSNTFTIESTTLFDAGYYDVVVSNGWRQTTSAAAWLTVAPRQYPGLMTIDPAFAPEIESVNGAETVRAMVRQPDGKLIVAGHFVRLNGVARTHLARLNADGTVDTTFDSGTGPDGTVNALALQADGRIVVAGNFLNYGPASRRRIARVMPDGSLDASFNPGTGFDNEVLALALQSGGKIAAAGQFATVDGNKRLHVARLNANGQLDPGLDVGSQADIVIYAVAAQPDGRLLFRGREGLLRVNVDGTPDSTFRRGTATNAVVGAILVLPDGKVLVGSNDAGGAVIRLNGDGSVDSSFSSGGSASQAVWAMTSQADGSVVVVGDFDSIGGFQRSGVARLLSNGRLDSNFAPPAWNACEAYAVVALPGDEVIAAGKFQESSDQPKWGLTRYRADGRLAPGFSGEIRSAGRVEAMIRQPDGKLLIGGSFNYVNGQRRDLIARLKPEGALDLEFQCSIRGGFDSVETLLRQPDGAVLVGGYFTQVNEQRRGNVARVGPTGLLDSTFAAGLGADGGVLDMALQSEGKIVLVGDFRHYDGVSRSGIARVDVRGTLDTTFDPKSGAGTLPVKAVLVQPDGRILLGGWFTAFGPVPRYGAVRLLADGSVDSSFGPRGDQLPSNIETMLLGPEGAIYLGGVTKLASSAPYVPFVRLLSDGLIDPKFDRTAYNGIWVAGALYLQADGRLLVGQATNGGSATPPIGLSRFTATGAEDTGFRVLDLQPAQLSRMIMYDDGSLVVAGVGIRDGRLARCGVARLVAATAPKITSTNVITFLAGRENTFRFACTGLPQAAVAINRELPRWLTFDRTAGLLKGTPPGSAAGEVIDLEIRASNGVGDGAIQSVTLTVKSQPSITQQPRSRSLELGADLSLAVAGTGFPAPGYQWRKDGVILPGATSSSLTLTRFELADAGAYDVTLTNDVGVSTSEVAVVGALAKTNADGSAIQVAAGIQHPNGNRYDQILMTGPAACIKAVEGRVTRVSFVDLNDDIVQLEFSGAGSLTLLLAGAGQPEFAVKYDQAVRYVKGHASVVVVGADRSTNLSLFSVGRLTALNQGIFRDVYYDGVADIASIAIASPNGSFGGLRAGDASLFARQGYTGVLAPGVQFAGPVYLRDLDAFESATPLLVFGGAPEIWVTGGNMSQTNGRPVQVGGISRISFKPGTNSHGVELPARANAARFEEQGVDVTDRIVLPPSQ